MLFLSIDFGTSSVKMSVLDENRNTLAWAKESYNYIILPGNKSEMKEASDRILELSQDKEGDGNGSSGRRRRR